MPLCLMPSFPPGAFMSLFPFMFPIKVSPFSFKAMLVLVHASCGLHHFLIWSSFWACPGPSQGQDRVLCIFAVYTGHGQVQGRQWTVLHQLSQLERSKPVLEQGGLCSWPCGWLLAGAPWVTTATRCSLASKQDPRLGCQPPQFLTSS